MPHHCTQGQNKNQAFKLDLFQAECEDEPDRPSTEQSADGESAWTGERGDTFLRRLVRLASRLILVTLSLALGSARGASPQGFDLADYSLRRYYAVHVSGGLYGVYLGHGLVITAAHVVGSANPPVRIGNLDLTAKVLKLSPFEQLDLALLSIDEEKLPISLRLRRMPICVTPPVPGEPVIVAIPENTARSQVVSPLNLPPQFRKRFPTAIKDVATTGNSGSGVFDANRRCLLGIMSRKFSGTPASGGPAKDIAKYFVPAPLIRAFIPSEYQF